MIIALPEGLPAVDTLKAEGLAVISRPDAALSMVNPARVALINLMPDKTTTETQFARLLARAPHPVHLSLLRLESHVPKSTSPDYFHRFYRPWSEVAGAAFDGLIITGAPIEQMPFEEVSYWDELTRVFDWSAMNVAQSMFVCWAGQAALYHRYGVQKQQMFQKMFGVFGHQVVGAEDPAMRDVGAVLPVPVSRHTEVHEADIAVHEVLEILARSDEAGVGMVRDASNRALINFNHLEYDADTLAREYLRDREAGLEIAVPMNYFPDDDPASAPRKTWQSGAQAVFTNWVRAALATKSEAAVDAADQRAARR